VERFNLGQDPGAFVGNPVVAAELRNRNDCLPLLLLDGKIVAEGSYPARETLYSLVGAPLPAPKLAVAQGCCAPTGAPTAKKCC